MRPEIVQDGPGACPICGMALEPVTSSATEEASEEYQDMKRRLWVSALLTAHVLLPAMGEMLPGYDHLVSGRTTAWVQFVLATPVVLCGGWVFFIRAWHSPVP